MATTRREALWALVCLVTIHVGSVTAEGYGDTASVTTTSSSVTTTSSSVTTVDFSSDRARDGKCSLKNYNCATGTTCIENSDKSRYICYCPDGYDGNGYKVGVVEKATGCTLPGNPVLCTSSDNCHQFATCMPFLNNTLSKCECKPGFTGNGSESGGCANVNECLSSPCVEHAICKDFPGSYSCDCDSSKNFVGDGKVKCTFVCFTHGDCDMHAKCNQTKCMCDDGFMGNGTYCEDKDECANGEAKCPGDSQCINTDGAFECACPNGYYLEADGCHKYSKNCNDLLKANPRLKSGRYKVDFDEGGPGGAMEVDCLVTGKIAVTEIAPLHSLNSPQPVPKDAKEQKVDYPGNPKDLINNSEFCFQKVYLQCTDKFNKGMIQWRDAQGTRHRGWGADKPNMCACGRMRLCPNNCTCGFGGIGVDEGLIMRKEQLPVTGVIFPATANKAGTYYVGKLRCGPQTFDIPKNCHEARFNPKYAVKEDTAMYIDVDGDGPRKPFLVLCNQDAYRHVGITEIPPDKLVIHRTATAGDSVEYLVDGPDIEALINGSAYCSQRVEYDCSKNSISEDGFSVKTSSGTYSYLPGGKDTDPGSCPCGTTNSCASTKTKCSCELGGVPGRKDIAVVFNKKNLPVLRVSSTLGKNFVKIGPLQCSQNQFGLAPNCEKLRQDGVTESYSYVIDPDGPPVNSTPNLDPFTVECKMDKNQGITIVNNENGDGLDLSTGDRLTIKYLDVSPPQVDALKDRSTGCSQEISFTCGSTDIDVSGVKYNGGKDFKALVGDLCQNGLCKCNTSFTVLKKEELPITSITGSKGVINIGSLQCAEIFPDCESYARFVRREGVLGEVRLTKDSLTIDPDGLGHEPAFVAKCSFKETVISNPSASKPFLRVIPKRPGPIEQCWNLTYTDQTGSGIGFPQMDALMDTARQCAQKLTLTCSNAVGTGMVSYRRCGGQEFTKFVDADIESTCECGVSGTCKGGPDVKCNCDASGNVKVKDENYIVNNKRLPICQVCMKLAGIETGSGAGAPSSRFIRFDVSELRCGRRPGVKKNCKMYRQEEQFNDLKSTVETSMWYDTTGKPIIVGCKFFPTPGHAEMLLRPGSGTFTPGEPDESPNITVVYRGFNITSLKEAVDDANYCTQDLLFFCADSLPSLSGSYGLFSVDQRLDDKDYTLRELNDEESSKVCKDSRFAAACQRCGPKPKRLVVTNKDKLPVTQVLLPKDLPGNLTVGVADTTCAYMEKDCDTILKKEKTESDLNSDGTYLIDPDQGGPVTPFSVLCEFNENVGVTKVPSNPDWVSGKVGGSGGVDGKEFSFKNKYPTATPEQINSLVQNSEFCWQGVKYECTETPLDTSTALLDRAGQKMTSFGKVDNSTVMGCACNVLGTCKTEGYTCNCAGKGSMVDRGFVTDKEVLPVTGFEGKVAGGGSASLTLTDVRCAPSPVDIPKDCAEAKTWKYRNGINYTFNGEYLIYPGKGRPFLVYCDFTTHPDNPMTVIKPKPTKGTPVGKENPEVPYQGPTDEQLQSLMTVSTHCYQPVKVDCYAAAFLKRGVRFKTTNGAVHKFWSTSGDKTKATCTCGSEKISLCGGNESLTQQLATKCNCDIGDEVWRSDAAILDITETGPITELRTSGVFDPTKGKLNLTVGDVYCTHQPLVFNECTMGYKECDARATCVDHDEGYHCVCPPGWQGKVVQKKSTRDRPMANGRQCIDDEECTLTNLCNRYNSDCVNTPGSYHCDCHAGYRHPPGDKFKCDDINECAEKTDDCDENAFCHNIDGSFRCRCKKGYRGKGKKGDCHKVGQCTCFGDPHCISFDNKWNHYQGRCTHNLVENDCTNTGAGGPKFRVSSKNWDRGIQRPGNFSWLKDVIIEAYNKTIVIGQGLTITVDGKPKKRSYRYLTKDKTKVLLRVARIGRKVEFYAHFGLDVIADGKDEVTVILPANFRESVCGMCGNYNSKPDDDWVVGPKCPALAGNLTTNEVLFGNSWTVDEKACVIDCDPPPLPTTKTCANPTEQTVQICNRLFNETSPFYTQGCLQKMKTTDLEGFKFACDYDLCYTNDMGLSMCEVAEAMGTYCLDLLGEKFQWRSSSMCEVTQCGENEEWKVCGPNSEPTCMSPEPVEITQCQENCYCKMGYVRQGETCVKAKDCGCLYDDGLMAIGEKQLVESCTKYVECKDHANLTETPHSCGTTHLCILDEQGLLTCAPIPTTTPKPTTTPEPTPPPTTTPEPTPPPTTTPEPTPPPTTTPEPTPPPTTTPEPTPPPTTTPEPTPPPTTTPEPTPPPTTTPEPTTPPPTTTPEPTTPPPTTTPEPTPPPTTTPEPTTPPPTTIPPPTTTLFPSPPPTTIPPPTTTLFPSPPPTTTPEPTTPPPTTTPEPTPPPPTTTPEPTPPPTTTPEPTTPPPTTTLVPSPPPTTIPPPTTTLFPSPPPTTTPEPPTTTPEPTPPPTTTPEPTPPPTTTPVPFTTPEPKPAPTTPEPTPAPTTPEPTPAPTTPEPTPAPTTPEPTPAPTTAPAPTTTPAPGPPPVACLKQTFAKTAGRGVYRLVQTPYKAKPISNITSITFSLRGARSDAYLMLSADKLALGKNYNKNLYEIALGHDSNTKSSIRRSKQGSAVATQSGSGHKPVDRKVFKYFWLSWKNGLVEIGARQKNSMTKEMENRPAFMSYQDPKPFSVNYLSVATGATKQQKIRYRFQYPCEIQPTTVPPTVPPPVTTPSVPLGSTPAPLPCVDGMCTEPNTKCVDGICVCEMGFTADCTHCVDIDECKVEGSQGPCTGMGQECVNTHGSYKCVCQEGYVMREDGSCQDIDECEDPKTNCGPHAECHNRLGTYECVCCMGYRKNGRVCRRNKRMDAVYGAPGKECCACTGRSCMDPDPVCGTDGKTYANYGAMVVRGCRDNRTIEVSYKGYCEKTCAKVKCRRPYQKCRQDAVSCMARCSCPDCSGRDSSNSGPVCATNGRVYASKCIFELVMCLTGRKDVTLESSLTPCGPGSNGNAGPVGPWSVWGPCSATCGRGLKKRTRTLRDPAQRGNYPLEESVICYTTCSEGPCKEDSCHNPGQVCEESSANPGQAECVCPDCKGQPESPVCAVVGSMVKTFESKCSMKKAACEITKNYILLKNSSCEDNPPSCAVMKNYAVMRDEDGCETDGKMDLGFCYGACDKLGDCCQPDFSGPDGNKTADLKYSCPDGTYKTGREKMITKCKCLQKPQH